MGWVGAGLMPERVGPTDVWCPKCRRYVPIGGRTVREALRSHDCQTAGRPAGFWWHDVARVLDASRFEVTYAKASSITVKMLHEWGRFAEPCACRTGGCQGWQMGHQWEDAIFDDLTRRAS